VPKLYDIRDAAKILGEKPSTMYTWIKQGKIPHIRIGRLIRFTPEKIDGFLQGNTR
jgi:excisionase family DNA binding protein